MYMNWNARRSVLLGFKGRTFEQPGEGGSGGDGGDGGGNEGGEGGDQGGAPGEGAGADTGAGGDQGKQAPGSILDAAKRGQAEGAEGQEGDYKAPDSIPEHMRGKDADETLSKVLAAYKGARESLAKGKGKLEGEVPKSAEEYQFTDASEEGKPDKVFAELSSEASKPLVSLAQKAAHKVGLPDKAFDAFMREFVSGAEAGGLPIGTSNEDAQTISHEAEMEALTEMVGGAAAAGTIVNTVEGYAQKLIDKGTMTKEDMNEYRMMVGTAEGAELFYRILTAEMGEKPIPRTEGGAGAMTQTEAYALKAKADSMPAGDERDAAQEEAQRAMQKAFGNESSGSLRVNVL